MKNKRKYIILISIFLLICCILGCYQEEKYSVNEISVEKANVRSCRNVECEIIGQLKKGDEITILSKDNDFTQIKYNNFQINTNTGYIHNKLYSEQVKTKLNFNFSKFIETVCIMFFLIIVVVVIKNILVFLIKLLFYFYFSKRRKYIATFILRWRYIDMNDYYEEQKKDNIVVNDPEIFVDDNFICAELEKRYNKNGKRNRYSHSTFHTEKKPVYKTEEYTMWERQNVYENGRYSYQNVPVTKTKEVFSHYKDVEIEDKHYVKVVTLENFKKLIKFKGDMFTKLVNKKAKKYQKL